MTASSVPMPTLHGGHPLVKPLSHHGRIEEGDGGATVGANHTEREGESDRPREKEKGTRKVRTVPRECRIGRLLRLLCALTNAHERHGSIRRI